MREEFLGKRRVSYAYSHKEIGCCQLVYRNVGSILLFYSSKEDEQYEFIDIRQYETSSDSAEIDPMDDLSDFDKDNDDVSFLMFVFNFFVVVVILVMIRL